MDLFALKSPFPREVVSWRAQTLNRDGNKALALAYIDARDVMNRLDEVCGPENWEDAYVETAKGRIIGTISIRINDQWVRKSDGAGDTDVEGEKGALSDALKRTAVKWGIGRYLYDMPNVWVPCESYEKNGKRYWSKWTDDPWNHVRSAPGLIVPNSTKQPEELTSQQLDALAKIDECDTLQRLKVWSEDFGGLFPEGSDAKRIAGAAFVKRQNAIKSMDQAAA